MVAMAHARGVSYGVVQAHLEFGAPLPPLLRSVKWPWGSAHAGEQQLDASGKEYSVHIPREERIALPVIAKPRKAGVCTACGAEINTDERMRIFVQADYQSRNHGLLYAQLCPGCMAQHLPASGPEMRDKYPRQDDAGNEINGRFQARCFRCREFAPKKQGVKIYARSVDMGHPLLRGYLCGHCWPMWGAAIKKSAQPVDCAEGA